MKILFIEDDTGNVFHVMVTAQDQEQIYIPFDITKIEPSENLLTSILLIAWLVLIILLFFIARFLSKKKSGPIEQLNEELSRFNSDQRGIRLNARFEDDEVGKIPRVKFQT